MRGAECASKLTCREQLEQAGRAAARLLPPSASKGRACSHRHRRKAGGRPRSFWWVVAFGARDPGDGCDEPCSAIERGSFGGVSHFFSASTSSSHFPPPQVAMQLRNA